MVLPAFLALSFWKLAFNFPGASVLEWHEKLI